MPKRTRAKCHRVTDDDTGPVSVCEAESKEPTCDPGEGRIWLPTRLCMIGRTGCGKTTTLLRLLTDPEYLMGRFRVIHVFSKTFKHDPEWEAVYVDPDAFFVHEEYDDNIVGQIMREQDEIKSKNPDLLEDVAIIVDDQGFGTSSRRPTNIANFDNASFMGRCLRVSLIVLVQKRTMASATFRDQKSHCMAWSNASKITIEMLLDDIGGMMEKKLLRRIFRYCTSEAYSFMYVKQVKGGIQQIFRGLEEEMIVNNVNLMGETDCAHLDAWLTQRGVDGGGTSGRKKRAAAEDYDDDERE